ncbi:MAG: CPBP family intramembrane metalloprotease [Paracoccaceae bacterium]|nr:CPBP family intramembrane metalloprotease [Paracoccaceae bacterium]
MIPLDSYVAAAARRTNGARSWGWSIGLAIALGILGAAFGGAFVSNYSGPNVDTISVVLAALAGFIVAGPILGGLIAWLRLSRMMVGVFLISLGWLLWTILTMSVVVLYHLITGHPLAESLSVVSALLEDSSPVGVLFKLVTFFGIWPAAWATVRLLHAQPFGTLFSPERRIRWGDFVLGFAMAGGFWLVTIVIGIAIIGAPARTELSIGAWAIALAPLAIMVFFQASAEELIFRGYILQQLAVRWRNPIIWGFLPAFLFGLAHYGNGAPLGVGWHYVVVTLLFGTTAAAMVWRTGSLAAAMGMHTGFNIFSLSIIGLEGILDGTQLFLYGVDKIELLFYADGISTFAVLLFVLSPLCPLRPRQAEPAAA